MQIEASVAISVIFSVDIIEDILHLLQNFLTDRHERPRTPGYLTFKTLLDYF